MTLRTLHRASAVIIAIFIVLHLLNHAALAGGVNLHIRIMEVLRSVYRFPPVEMVLLAAIAFQVYSGLRFLATRIGHKKDRWLWIQILSGAYLVHFFLNHIGATLFTRWSLGLDTNIYFASAGCAGPRYTATGLPSPLAYSEPARWVCFAGRGRPAAGNSAGHNGSTPREARLPRTTRHRFALPGAQRR